MSGARLTVVAGLGGAGRAGWPGVGCVGWAGVGARLTVVAGAGWCRSGGVARRWLGWCPGAVDLDRGGGCVVPARWSGRPSGVCGAAGHAVFAESGGCAALVERHRLLAINPDRSRSRPSRVRRRLSWCRPGWCWPLPERCSPAAASGAAAAPPDPSRFSGGDPHRRASGSPPVLAARLLPAGARTCERSGLF